MYNTKELPLYKTLTNEEGLISNALSSLIEPNSSILDIGCGSGAIAMKIKSSILNLKIDAVELDVSQIKFNNVFEKIYNLDFEFYEFEKRYDYIILSHVLGHFNTDFRYNKCLSKIISSNPKCKILIVTNAVIGKFKIIQEAIWELINDRSYYIDLTQLIGTSSLFNKISISPILVDLTCQDQYSFYRLLETFSPTPLPDKLPKKLKYLIEEQIMDNNSFSLQIPQFLINVDPSIKITGTYSNCKNHEEIWANT